MTVREFVESFIRGDFVRKNIPSHLQAGFPIPVQHSGGLGIELYYHKLVCNEEQITLSSPVLRVGLVYPSGRLYLLTEFDEDAYRTHEAAIQRKRIYAYRNAVEQAYAACDEVTGFYHEHSTVPQIMIKRCYQTLEKAAEEIGAEEWYGGLYDSYCGI